MSMVKAFSYGSGSYEIATMLQFHKVDYLAVAYTDEGATLRQNGIKLPVMVMSPEPQTFETLRSEEHTSELQSLMRSSYAVFCLPKKNKQQSLILITTHINNNSTYFQYTLNTIHIQTYTI